MTGEKPRRGPVVVAAAAAYMYEGTPLWSRLDGARRLLEEALPPESLYQVRESSRITYYRHVVPTALEPKADVVEDALPLFIMYAHNAAEEASRGGQAVRERLPGLVYGALRGFLAEKGEKETSTLMKGLEVLRRSDEEGLSRGERLGPLYSLLFAVLVAAQIYASGVPVMRLSLAPLYALARRSIEALGEA